MSRPRVAATSLSFCLNEPAGDGNVGEDVSGNIKVIHNVPLKLNKPIPYIEVRGEVYMPKKSFESISNSSSPLFSPILSI